MQIPCFSRLGRALAAALLLHLAAAAHAQSASLYERLGGGDQLSAIVSDLIDRSRTGPGTSRSFEKVNLKRLKEQITLHLCTLTGGPCSFAGDDLKTIHAGLNITQAEFYGLVEVLRQVLDDRGIGTREKNELLALLAPFKRDVVTK